MSKSVDKVVNVIIRLRSRDDLARILEVARRRKEKLDMRERKRQISAAWNAFMASASVGSLVYAHSDPPRVSLLYPYRHYPMRILRIMPRKRVVVVAINGGLRKYKLDAELILDYRIKTTPTEESLALALKGDLS